MYNRFLVVVIVLIAVLAGNVTPSYAVNSARLTITDLTTSTVLTGYGSASNPYPFTVGHRYQFKYGEGFYYQYLKLWVGGSWSNVVISIDQLGSGGCSQLTSPVRVDCDAAPSEQGEIYRTITITATLSTAITTDVGFYKADQIQPVPAGDHQSGLFYET